VEKTYVCVECGSQYEDLGDGKCYICGGEIIPIDEVLQDEEEKYPEHLLQEGDEEIKGLEEEREKEEKDEEGADEEEEGA